MDIVRLKITDGKKVIGKQNKYLKKSMLDPKIIRRK
jgi:hypothetical protein